MSEREKERKRDDKCATEEWELGRLLQLGLDHSRAASGERRRERRGQRLGRLRLGGEERRGRAGGWFSAQGEEMERDNV